MHRCLLCLCLTEPGGLVKLGRSLHEQAGVYYLEESRRILSMHAERRSPPPELNARVSFKVLAPVHVVLQPHVDDSIDVNYMIPVLDALGTSRPSYVLCCCTAQKHTTKRTSVCMRLLPELLLRHHECISIVLCCYHLKRPFLQQRASGSANVSKDLLAPSSVQLYPQHRMCWMAGCCSGGVQG